MVILCIIFQAWKVNKFIKDEQDAKKDSSEYGQMTRDATIVRGGQEFTDQFHSQHMRFYKGVSLPN